MRSTTSLGMPFGPTMPNQAVVSKPGNPDSAMVGTSGIAGDRLAVVTASARTRPDFTCGTAVAIWSNNISIWPPITSVMAAALPLYGTCLMSALVVSLNNSHARCCEVPLPPEPQLKRPGFALACATSSATFLAGKLLLVTSISGDAASMEIGVKSSIGSYGTLANRLELVTCVIGTTISV